MAGAFTHMSVVSKAREAFPKETFFARNLRTNLNFLTFGSVSPDVPYLTLTEKKWADTMHYHHTNGIVGNGLQLLLSADERDDAWWCKLAWLLGYISHLVTDATVHPIVEALVGPYEQNKKNHRICEMIHDVMILNDVKNLELGEADYADIIRDCKSDPSFDAVCTFWEELARTTYPQAEPLSVGNVFAWYSKTIDLADGGNKFARAFRHFGSDIVYDTHDELIENKRDLVDKYYLSVQLPSGQKGTFLEDGFNHAAENLASVWKEVQAVLFTQKTLTDVIPNWNLDTGIDQTTGQKTYWS